MITTSAPAKIILFGEHAVNRKQMAIATALDARTRCKITPRTDAKIVFRSGDEQLTSDCGEIEEFTRTINALRLSDDRAAIREHAQDFFAPTKYVYGTFSGRYRGGGAEVEWESKIPSGSGLGSGAAASAALVLALARASGHELTKREIAELAWHGDIIAHGGIASGLDTSGSTFGGVICYTLKDGAENISIQEPPTLVVGDTGVRANTAVINARVSEWLRQDDGRIKIFEKFGDVAKRALRELKFGNWNLVGELMNENQALLEEIGVSSMELENLTAAARDAGALGAKLAGAGGGGVMVALTTAEQQAKVARAIEAAGGRALVVAAGVQGVRDE